MRSLEWCVRTRLERVKKNYGPVIRKRLYIQLKGFVENNYENPINIEKQ